MSETSQGLEQHQYIDRESGRICTERPYGDRIVNYLYGKKREQPPFIYQLLGSQWFSSFLGWVNYDFPFGENLSGMRRFLRTCGIDLRECLDPPHKLDSARKIFERRIRYWECRPMSLDERAVVCPADARVLVGSLKQSSMLFLKGKFFHYEELIGQKKGTWQRAFSGGEFLICRLTADKYHFNHTPVAGLVRDYYEHDGAYHSCNPGPILTLSTPYSKNKRVVTIIDTDVSGGSRVGLVAMIEIAALMIGEIVQCYSAVAYEEPQPIAPGLFVERGCPKSLFRPGSSTTVLLFQSDRIEFAADLIRNLYRADISSRYSEGLGRPLVETDVKVRATIARPKTTQLREVSYAL